MSIKYPDTSKQKSIHGAPYHVTDADRLENMRPLDLWTWLDESPQDEVLQMIDETGGTYPLETNYEPVAPMANLGFLEDKFIQFMKDNRDDCQHKHYEVRAYHSQDIIPYMRVPSIVGYNHRNTSEYNWGLMNESNEQLKELVGGDEAFKKMGLIKETCFARALVFLPGNHCPWHFDMMEGWAVLFKHLNPHMLRGPELIEAIKNGERPDDMSGRNYCDLGKIVRRLITINDWRVGQNIDCAVDNEIRNFGHWKSGDVWNMPMPMYHGSQNGSYELKMTLLFTGVESE